MEPGAPAGGGLRRAGHGPGELLGEAVGVLGQAEELGGGERGGDGDLAHGGAGTAQLPGEGVQVPVPGGEGAGLLGGEPVGRTLRSQSFRRALLRVTGRRDVRCCLRGRCPFPFLFPYGLRGRVRNGFPGAFGGKRVPVPALVGRWLVERRLVVPGFVRRYVVGAGGVRRRLLVPLDGQALQMGQDRVAGGPAAGQGVGVEGERPSQIGVAFREGRVLLVLGGLVRPRLDLAVTGGAVLVQRLQEGRRAARPLLGRAPPVAGAEEERAGAGEGDVPQAQFLRVLVLLHLLLERLDPLGVEAVEGRKRRRVAAQGVREHLGLGGPRVPGLGAGELAGDQSGHGDDVPLQPLGLVSGEDLHGVLAAGQRVVEALLVLCGGPQEAEEGEQRRLAVQRGEPGRCVQEVGQRLAAAGGQRLRGRGQLDLQTGGGQDPVQHVHQGVRERAAQVAQLPGETGEADAGLGGERQPVVGRVPRDEEGVQRVRERYHLGRVRALDGLREPPVRVGVVRLARPVHQEAGAAAEEREVAGADAPARSGEQADQ
ncbi:hypothetical protein SBADM41S_11413 [Streptomyces badius]